MFCNIQISFFKHLFFDVRRFSPHFSVKMGEKRVNDAGNSAFLPLKHRTS